MKVYSNKLKVTSWFLLITMTIEMILPNRALALTTGPSQPEFQAFEPVSTTDMVDLFSGDFVYNIPLMDVEGYPINISYHGGVSMEQEASWVGLGWNINPGAVNRAIRGLPDDFNGEKIQNELHIKSDITASVGIKVGVEKLGIEKIIDPAKGKFSAGVPVTLFFNNYKGVSSQIGIHLGFKSRYINAGVNLDFGGHTGFDINTKMEAQYEMPNNTNANGKDKINLTTGASIGIGQGFNSRSGFADFSITQSTTFSKDMPVGKYTMRNKIGYSQSSTIPISFRNYVPVITNSTSTLSRSGRFKIGKELFPAYGYLQFLGGYTEIKYNNDGDRSAFGYANLQNSDHNSIVDFTRDKDGLYNTSVKYLPMSAMTYDIYNVTGQGTGGMFRMFRNDFGAIFDPEVNSTSQSESYLAELGIYPNLTEIGADFSYTQFQSFSRNWDCFRPHFQNNTSGKVYENAYFKQGGELTSIDDSYYNLINRSSGLGLSAASSLPNIVPGSDQKRVPRGNLIYYNKPSGFMDSSNVAESSILSYDSSTGFASGPHPSTTRIRKLDNAHGRRSNQFSEIVQLQKDGRRYVYGIAAINNLQKETNFSVNCQDGGNYAPNGLVDYIPGVDDNHFNGKGNSNYYNSTITPSFAHSYLLTSVLSTDYEDVTGDGISDDDLGTYTKINYTLKEKDYRWKAPYDSAKAQHSPGNRSDPEDDKGAYSSGSREQWYVHSIESRNYVAEFYISERDDACGMSEPIITHGLYAHSPYDGSVPKAKSYKLDSIKLFNKHDRFINRNTAIAIKSVFFAYDYSLCKGIPNNISGDTTQGKLTLKKIYFRYGNSEKSLMSPYKFSYGFNPNYNYGCKDRWGTYKPQQAMDNFDFPFVNQDDPNVDTYAGAWGLNLIHLPSGGDIAVEYESDDYGYVQNQVAEEMFTIKGIGNSTDYTNGNCLYTGPKSINRYLYFKRRIGNEHDTNAISNYCKEGKIIYFNAELNMAKRDPDRFKANKERFKGYFEAKGCGVCPNDTTYGYIQLDVLDLKGGGFFKINPITLCAINEARYSMPQLVYKSAIPTADIGRALLNALSAFGEITSLFRNPIVKMLHKGTAKEMNLERSFIRLLSPNLCKKGGGHRVKSLKFSNNWDQLAGGNESNFTYGKKYIYKTDNLASSGVASYEPVLGGDENALRLPYPYRYSRAHGWPPVDAIDLYQEGPIGESLYPGASVGYSHVYEVNLNSDKGKSARTFNLYEFYTAKEFPIKVQSSNIEVNKKVQDGKRIGFKSKHNSLEARQSFNLKLNDMHGKPKAIKNEVFTDNYNNVFRGHREISSVAYKYFARDSECVNQLPCLVHDPINHEMKLEERTLGVDVDVNLDSRYKHEHQRIREVSLNVNIGSMGVTIVAIPTGFLVGDKLTNDFKCATVTKVTQSFGILKEICTKIDNATIVEKNVAFDPQTGEVLVTSVNNEYDDNLYKVSVPAYWSYDGMGSAYTSINYEEEIPFIAIDSAYRGRFYNSNNHFAVGDQLRLKTPAGDLITAWYLGNNLDSMRDQVFECNGYILPRFPRSTAGWHQGDTLRNVSVIVQRSGHRNMLQVPAEVFTTLNSPFVSGKLAKHQTKLVNLQANTYCDSNTALFFKYIISADTINPYVTGERGIYRMLSSYSYVDKRNRDVNIRNTGLFEADRMYINTPTGYSNCDAFPYSYFAPNISDQRWVRTNYVSKYSPFGAQIENVDALNNYSTAQYGYNDDLPTAIGKNMKQGELFYDGFEDYNQLHVIDNIMDFKYSFIKSLFGFISIPATSTVYNKYLVSTGNGLQISDLAAHTGLNSLYCPGATGSEYSINIPLNNTNYSSYGSVYNSYYRSLFFPFNAHREYLPYKFTTNMKHYCSIWVNFLGAVVNPTTYTLGSSCGIKIGSTLYPFKPKTKIIEGWQQFEVEFDVASGATTASIEVPKNVYIDDIRMYPKQGSVKSFAYHPVNQRLMAALDENNIAVFYEYDLEGNLIRTKKETEKGIMTISESRGSKTQL